MIGAFLSPVLIPLVLLFVIALEVWRKLLAPWFFGRFFSSGVSEAVVWTREPNADDDAVTRWWAVVRDAKAEQKDSGGEATRRMNVQSVLALRVEATREFFRRKLQGDAPQCLWQTGWKGFFAELSGEERNSLFSLLFVSFWHATTVALAFSTRYWLLSAQLTWALNVGDLLLIAARQPNVNAARNVSQLIVHHAVSVIGIPLMTANGILTPFQTFAYQFILEFTGGFSAFLNALSLTPLSRTRAYFALVAAFLVSLVLLRGPLWTLLILDVWNKAPSDRIISIVALCVLHSAMGLFNWFMMAAFWKRAVSAARVAGLDMETTFGRRAGPALMIVTAFCRNHEAILALLVFGSAFPLLGGLTFAALLLLFAANLKGLTFGGNARRSRLPGTSAMRVILSDYHQCVEVLRSADFSPTPARYITPRPLVAPLAAWVRSMLLYSDFGDHSRLRAMYPRLNFPAYVREHLQAFVEENVVSLLLPLRGTRMVDFVEICHVLPWKIMQRISGIPRLDVERTRHLIRQLGDFVGRPITTESLHAALAARNELCALIEKWRSVFEKRAALDGEPLDIAQGGPVLPFWLAKKVFATNAEFESNVVMLLFAGTHNLENVLGHCVRLLLENPDELQALRDDHSLLTQVVDESLRICPPIKLIPRTATKTLTTSWGQTFHTGETVLLDVVKCNRMLADRPDQFVLNRNERRHVAFGFGPHICNGSALGRSETKELVKSLLIDEVAGRCDLVAAKTEEASSYATLLQLDLSFSDSVSVVLIGNPLEDLCSAFSGKDTPFAFRVSRASDVQQAKASAADIAFAFVTEDGLDTLRAIRDAVGRDCFKIGVVVAPWSTTGRTERMQQYWRLKSGRFNLLLVFDANHRRYLAVTAECGFIELATATDALRFILKRRNVRWFATDVVQDAGGAIVYHQNAFSMLLQLSLDANLFSGALDPTSGNVSCVCSSSASGVPSLLVTPRQVDKSKLQNRDAVLVREVASMKLECCLPQHLQAVSGVKSSIDSGVLCRLYQHFKDVAGILHFHSPGGALVEAVDAETTFPYPCGVLEEALHIIDVADGLRPPFCVRLIQHGYLMLLDAESVVRVEEQWRNVLRLSGWPQKVNTWAASRDEAEDLSGIAKDIPFAVFKKTHIIGVTVVTGEGKRLGWRH